ncbi:hypothetical protein JOE11_004189 [Robbsia andropogonis]
MSTNRTSNASTTPAVRPQHRNRTPMSTLTRLFAHFARAH